MHRSAQRGFTLTELAVTVAIVSVVSAVAIGVTAKPIGASATELRDTAIAETYSHLQRTIQQVRVLDPNVTPADAVAAGFPPDVRGVIRLVQYSCQGSADQMLTSDQKASVCNSAGHVIGFFKMTYEALRAGGDLEVVSTVYLPGKSYYQGQQGGLWIGRSATADITSVSQSPIGGEDIELGDTSFYPIRCYLNGTCDPFTYYFSVSPWVGFGSSNQTPKQSRIAVTATGSIVTINSWN